MKTIFFDLGNVLIFFDLAKMCKQVADVADLHPQTAAALLKRYSNQYERGEIDSQFLHEKICEAAGKPLDFSALMRALSHIFEPNLPTISLALQLKEKGHPLFLLSNTCEAHFEHAHTQFDFLKRFDGYILSYEVKAQKPEEEIFLIALRKAGCSPLNCFYTDDVQEHIDSARALQMDAERYTDSPRLHFHLSSRGLI